MMSVERAKNVWQKACAVILGEVNSISYKNFIEVLIPLGIKDDVLVLEAPTEASHSAARNIYFQLICSCIHRVDDTVSSVLITVPEERDDFIPTQERAQSDLYSKYTFDTFVIGNSNYFAQAAARAVAKHPAKAYNPLFIYGGVGLGKTHLMHAVGHEVKLADPKMNVMYVTSETFTNEMIQSIASNRNREFRARYRSVDVLMVDDIHFISRKEGVQEEFFHTFNALHSANKQIIISSDRPPKEIEKLEERLRSRFEWGLIADVQPPAIETRIAILKRRSELENMSVPNDVLEFIAEHVESNIRELEGSLNRVMAFAKINRLDINLPVCQEALKDIMPNTAPRKLDPVIIRDIVAEYFGQSSEAIGSKRRDQEISSPRQIAMYLSRELTDFSLSQIGSAYGGKNHTTVLHAYNKIADQIKTDTALAGTVADLRKRLTHLPPA